MAMMDHIFYGMCHSHKVLLPAKFAKNTDLDVTKEIKFKGHTMKESTLTSFPSAHCNQDYQKGYTEKMVEETNGVVRTFGSYRLGADPETDGVYAQITLLAETDQSEVTRPDHSLPEPPSFTPHSFSKTLAASDTNTHGGLSISRNIADDCLPQLDMSQQAPWQELVASEFSWQRMAFSSCILREANGELHIGVRRCKSLSKNMTSYDWLR